MPGDSFYGLSQWFLFLLTVGLLYGGAEVGYRYGCRFADRTGPEVHSHVATVEGALLGLLALLLGFAFAMAISRFDARKLAVTDEGNDLQTAFLRAQLLPDPHAAACTRLLREYLSSRVEYYQAGADAGRVRAAEEWTNRVQGQLWAEAVAASRGDPNEVKVGYFIESLNALLDDHTRRQAAMENHVPEAILDLLLLVATLTLAVTGYSSGLRRKRLKALRLILVVLVSATLLVVVDLDRPRRGLIRVSEAGMVRLQADLDRYEAKR